VRFPSSTIGQPFASSRVRFRVDGGSKWRRGAAETVRTAFWWLALEGHIDRSPVDGARAPTKTRREVIISPETFQKIHETSRPDFRRLLEFIWRTGCRPHEVVRIKIRHVDLSLRRIVFPPSEAKGKRHPRVIYLDDRAIEIVRDAAKSRTSGFLFRNAHGKQWHRNIIRCRFRRLRDKVGGDFCAYHLRHSYATAALQALDPITVATLMGHSDATTLARNYQHLAKLPAVMQEAARKATFNFR
jgi:integrase